MISSLYQLSVSKNYMTVSEPNGWLPNKVDSERSQQVNDFKVCDCKFPYAVKEQNLQCLDNENLMFCKIMYFAYLPISYSPSYSCNFCFRTAKLYL